MHTIKKMKNAIANQQALVESTDGVGGAMNGGDWIASTS
jgi:hypothetical protein